MTKLTTRVLTMITFFAMCSTAHAEGFALYENSARGVALGGATMARKADPSSMANNPAVITQLEGIQIQAGASAITPAGKVSGKDQNGNKFSSELKPNTWVVPHFYYTQKLTDKLTVGVAQHSRFGLGFEYPHNWPGRFNVYQVDFQTASVIPTAAVAFTENFSLGFGVEVMHANLDLRKRSNVTRALPGGHTLDMEVDSNISNADDYGVGFNFGGHYKFNDEWAMGLSYKSSVHLKNKGPIEYTLERNNMPGIGEVAFDSAFKDGSAQGNVKLPQSVSGGVSWSPTTDLSFEVGAIWTEWSSFNNLDIAIPEPLVMSKSPKDWSNTWRLNFGVEYEALDWLTLRAGYVYDQSPMTDKYADYLVPTDDRHIYSAGLGFTYENMTLDLAYAYIDPIGRKYKQDDSSGTHVLTSSAKSSKTDIISASFGYKF